MKIPNSWDEVYVDQYIELTKVNDKDLSFIERNLEILSILTDTMPYDDIWGDISVDELNKYIKDINWLRKEPTTNFSKKIFDLTIIDIYKLKFGEFIDIDNLLISGIDNITKICSILYKKTMIDQWGNTIYEPYGIYDIDERSKLFNEVYITEIYGIIKYFSDFKSELMSIYELLFEPIIEDDFDEEEYIKENPDEREEIEQEKIFKKWSWESVIHKLSNGDITKYDYITDLPVIFIFNQLSYLRDMKL